MNVQFRPLQHHEIKTFCQVVDKAYANKVRQLFGNSARGRWRHYDESRVEVYLSRETEGMRVGVMDDTIVTVCICRSYGSLGWFHTLAVHPQFQHQGLGMQAVADAEAYLSQQGARTIALMTWPDAIDNISFYQKQGYQPQGLSLNAIREVEPPISHDHNDMQMSLLSETPFTVQAKLIEQARRLSEALWPGLDYTPWLRWTQQQSSSDVMFFWQQEEMLGFAVAERYPRAKWLAVRLLLLAPEVTTALQVTAIAQLCAWAKRHHFEYFGFPLDMFDVPARDLLQQLGFRLFRDTMIDFSKGECRPHKGLHLVRYSG